MIAIVAGIIVVAVAAGIVAVTTGDQQQGTLENQETAEGKQLTLDFNENLSLKENP